MKIGIGNDHVAVEYKKEIKKYIEEKPTKKICPYCQSEISIKASRCPHCTSQLEN